MSLNATSLPTLSLFSRLINRIAIFLLRRNWIRSLGETRMVLTTRHPITGRRYSTAILYARDGSSLIAASREGAERWYRYATSHPDVRLVVQGKRLHAYALTLRDSKERRQAFQAYRKKRPEMSSRLSDGREDTPIEKGAEAFQEVELLRFLPLSW